MNRPEQALQIQMAEWLHYALPPEVWWTAVNPVPAKGKRRKNGKPPIVASLSKAMGMKAGAPDLIFCIRGRFVGVEVKAGRGKPSDDQSECHRQISLAGGTTQVVTSTDMLKEFLESCRVKLKAT